MLNTSKAVTEKTISSLSNRSFFFFIPTLHFIRILVLLPTVSVITWLFCVKFVQKRDTNLIFNYLETKLRHSDF